MQSWPSRIQQVTAAQVTALDGYAQVVDPTAGYGTLDVCGATLGTDPTCDTAVAGGGFVNSAIDPQTGRFHFMVEATVDLPDHLPDGLTELVEGMLEADPSARPSAAEVAASLEPLIAELPSKLTLSRRGRIV